jgi:hypothetical protein
MESTPVTGGEIIGTIKSLSITKNQLVTIIFLVK